jgi:hypothetical protein
MLLVAMDLCLQPSYLLYTAGIWEPIEAMCQLIFTFLELSHPLCYLAIHESFATEPRFLPLGYIQYLFLQDCQARNMQLV